LANELTAFNPEYWTPTMQETFFKESVALGIANTELRADLKDGDTLHKPYGSYARVQTYTKGTDISVKDISSTDDTLTVSTAKVASFYVDDIDRIQNKYDTIKEFAAGAMRQLNNVLDQAVFAEYSNAGTTLTGVSIGEAAGGIVMTAANTANIFTAAGRVLNSKKRLGGERFALIGPRMLEIIQQYVGGRETGFGDTVSDNGKVANRFGFGLRLSNNLPFSAVWTPADNPTAAATLTIAGVTFTFRAVPALPGEIDIGSDTAGTIDNLVLALNGTGTPGASTYIELSAENRQLIEESGIVAVDGTTTLDITGYGDIVVASSEAADVWSSVFQYALMGQVGAIDLVTQVAPNIVFRDAQLRLGKYVHPWMLFGKKTFTRMADSLVAVKFDVSAWV
jgi:hypothetical protein